MSGYKGQWDKYVREGKGLMIWPNHDFYRGEWKNGVMSGYGMYIWDAYYNNTLSLPSITAYRGLWFKGQRNGYGILNLGLGLGSHYKGEFKNNMKHGVGKFVSNNGLILQSKNLFIDDNFGPLLPDSEYGRVSLDNKRLQQLEPYKFDICDRSVGLCYHIVQALKNIDKQEEIRANMINDYIENNKPMVVNSSSVQNEDPPEETSGSIHDIDDLIIFEESSLRKALRCYETDLKNIYYKYATVCNTEEIYFTPVLTRLLLWQLYYDCNIHEKGLTLVEIDRLFHQNPEWLARTPHDPFEKIYFWQFLHSLISVGSRLYAKKQLPGPKPDTILASGFRTFMETVVLPGVTCRRGKLANGYGSFIPLKRTYELYRSLGEPHTVRTFLRAVRCAPHYCSERAPATREGAGAGADNGDGESPHPSEDDADGDQDEPEPNKYKLFNFGNLSNKAIIQIFSHIFPQICTNDIIMDLEIEITFYEFFEAFVACAEESIRVKNEELRWRERFLNEAAVVSTGPGLAAHITNPVAK
ncbi:Radial spoke head 10-like protein B2 [Operophtera brumata]|uniref:Radial spoke head 10-like protein B2 n=1 Tax=Operophtera brumata TaxID=104452 RepID=A0A0L7LK03_OPEBR|nr:Radial spoke head 10-like protein B2 [Operophtera brumata]